MTAAPALAAGVSALREEFDAGFAKAEVSAVEQFHSVLALKFDTVPYAVPLADVSELNRAPPILAVPSSVSTFLGLIAVRGAPLPAYDLGAMLGHAPAASCAWMLLIRAPRVLGFVFDDYEGLRHIAEADQAGDAVRDAGTWRPLIHLPRLTESLQE